MVKRLWLVKLAGVPKYIFRAGIKTRVWWLSWLLALIPLPAAGAAGPVIILIDQGEHGQYMRDNLNRDGLAYTFYNLAEITADGNLVNQMELALAQARINKADKIILPYIFVYLYPGIFNEFKLAHDSGIEIYISAPYDLAQRIEPQYLQYVTVVGTVGVHGELLDTVNYADVELLANGCDQTGLCSNSLGAARAAEGSP